MYPVYFVQCFQTGGNEWTSIGATFTSRAAAERYLADRRQHKPGLIWRILEISGEPVKPVYAF